MKFFVCVGIGVLRPGFQVSRHPKPAFRNPKSSIRNLLKSGSWPTSAKLDGTGCIFGDMLIKLLTPHTLKCSATSIQGIRFGKIGKFASQIAKLHPTAGYAGILDHIQFPISCLSTNGPFSSRLDELHSPRHIA